MTSVSKTVAARTSLDSHIRSSRVFGTKWLLVLLPLVSAATPSSAEIPPFQSVPVRQFAAPLLLTEGELSEEVRDIFWRAAGKYRAQIVVLAGSKTTAANSQFPWQSRGSQNTTVVRIAEFKTANDADHLRALLRAATGIWLEELQEQVPAETRQLIQLELDQAVRQTKLPLGCPATTAEQFGLREWLPAARFVHTADDSSDAEDTASDPQSAGTFRIALLPGDALAIEGRTLFNLGQRPVQINFPPEADGAAATVSLRPGQPHDLVALERATWFRWPEKPAAKIEPIVPHGSLVIVGGGGTPKGLVEKFIELAGGPEASIIVLPTALGDISPPRNEVFEVRMLERAGAKNVVLLPQTKKEEVESAEFREALHKAGGVWFGGGRQWRFVDAYAGTQAVALFHDVLARGGVIGGSSAGASIQGDFMCRGNPLGNLDIDSFGYQQGFAFLPGSAIDQHFTQRNRLPDLTKLIRQRPQFLGIGLDESTAIVVQKSTAEVFGAGNAFFVDGSLTAEVRPTVHQLKAGEAFDLKLRQPIVADEAKEVETTNETNNTNATETVKGEQEAGK